MTKSSNVTLPGDVTAISQLIQVSKANDRLLMSGKNYIPSSKRPPSTIYGDVAAKYRKQPGATK